MEISSYNDMNENALMSPKSPLEKYQKPRSTKKSTNGRFKKRMDEPQIDDQQESNFNVMDDPEQ